MGTDTIRCIDVSVRDCGSFLLVTFIGNTVKLNQVGGG